MSMPNYEDALKEAQVGVTTRRDVITIAQELREGLMPLNVQPVSNGFIVAIGYDTTVVCTKSTDVGLLVKTLYSSNLEKEDILKRLRRLMGYK